MRATDAPVHACSVRQLELLAEAESGRARPGRAVANDRRGRNPDREVLPDGPAGSTISPDGTRSAASRAGITKSPTRGQRTLPRLAVSPDEAAEILGVSRDYFDEHVIGELRVVRRGRRILVAVAELERWLDRAAARATVGRGS